MLWWLSDDARLGRGARDCIAEPANDIVVSVASLWEIVVKVRIGKLAADIDAVEQAILADGFERLAITPHHLATLATLPVHHRDLVDHRLIAQPIREEATMISDNRTMPLYPVKVMRAGE